MPNSQGPLELTPNAIIFPQAMDPADVIDFKVNTSAALEDGETIVSYTIVLPAESLLFGLSVDSNSRVGNEITMWLSMSEDPLTPVTLPIEVNIVTSSNRTKQRTLGVKVDQL